MCIVYMYVFTCTCSHTHVYRISTCRPHADPFGNVYAPHSFEGRRAGTPLCGAGAKKFCAIPFVIRGDLDWYLKVLKLNNYNSNTPCALCACNTTTRPWRDFGRSSAWLDSVHSTLSWRAANPHPACGLFLSPLISIACINPDWMHTMHLGVYTYAFASVLWLLAYELLEEDPARNMVTIMRELRAYWKTHATLGHFQGITLSMFSVENDPERKQPQLKGTSGEIKRLSKALLHVFKAHKRRGFATHAEIGLMLKKWIEMDDILDEHPGHIFPKLPPTVADTFENLAFDSLALLTSVAGHYMRVDPKPLFNVTVKAHMLAHCGIHARFLNPRLAICYGGEDYMKHMKRAVFMASRGTKANNIGKKMADKVVLAMHCEMSAGGNFRNS